MVIVIEIIPQNLNVQLLSQWNGIYRVDKNSLTKFTPWKRQRDLVCMKRPWLINIWTNDTFSSSANYLFRNEYLTFIHPFMNRNYQEALVTCRKSEYRQTINIINIIHIRIWNKGMSFKPKKIYLFCLEATWWLWCRSLRLVRESLVSPPFCNNLLTRKPV